MNNPWVSEDLIKLFRAVDDKKYDTVERLCPKISDDLLKIGMLHVVIKAVKDFDFSLVKLISKHCGFPEARISDTSVHVGKMLEFEVDNGEKSFAVTLEPDRFLHEFAKLKRQMKIMELN